MRRDIVEPTKTFRDGPVGGVEEEHPGFGMISASRVSSSPGAVLFDSEIRHQHYVTVKISGADRRRDLNRDWLHPRQEKIEVAMSEAQWASFVSSMNTTGVPCTVTFEQGKGVIPGFPFEPRMQESMKEVREAGTKAMEAVQESFAELQEVFEAGGGKKAMREAIRKLENRMGGVPGNMEFAAKSLTEHAENVVQKAKVDIEAMVLNHAQKLGLENPEQIVKELTSGDES